MNRHRRNEVTHYTLNSMHRNTPDTKKTKYMIYSESIKIVTHLFETIFPPGKTVFPHSLPVVGRKAPVLSLYCKIIRWGSCLHVHVVKRGLLPCVTTIPVDTNGNITF